MNTEIESLPAVPAKRLLVEALAHLGAAEIQFTPSEDAIIREHIGIARALLAQAIYGPDFTTKRGGE